jgi:HAD superfamily hydrolase (TIGR01509 family)
VIFDMDGLILDTEPLYKAAWQRTAAELGFEIQDDWYLNLVGLREQESEQELSRHFGPTFPLDAFRQRWPAAFRARADADGVPVKAGLAGLLAFVEQRGLRHALATSSHRGFADISLRLAGLDEAFTVIVTGDEVTQAKPAPDIYIEAARRVGVAPERCLALEDSDPGILAAHAAGMIALLVPDLKPPSDEARAAAYRVLGSLHEVADVVAELDQSASSRVDANR